MEAIVYIFFIITLLLRVISSCVSYKIVEQFSQSIFLFRYVPSTERSYISEGFPSDVLKYSLTETKLLR